MRLRERILIPALTASVALFASTTSAQNIYSPGDFVIAIDLDDDSSFPAGETPFNATDQDPVLKYLNFGGRNTGLLVTPAFGPSVIQSLNMTTANDFASRDPTVFSIYGTNEPVELEQNGFCDVSDFTPISEQTPITLPGDPALDDMPPGSFDARFMQGEVVNFANLESFTSYLIIIDDIKDENLFGIMQIGDIQLYTGPDGTGEQILAAGDSAIACESSMDTFSSFPAAEIPTNIIDGFNEPSNFGSDKYLNFGEENSGFIISRGDGMSVILDGFVLETANDAPERDPFSFVLQGTNSPVTSAQNSTGEEEIWVDVAMGSVEDGDFTIPEDRFSESSFIAVDNEIAYNAYRMFFPAVRDSLLANSMQIGEIIFSGEAVEPTFVLGDINGDGVVDLFDVSPFVSLLTSGEFNPAADINGDGMVDLFDVSPFVALLTGG